MHVESGLNEPEPSRARRCKNAQVLIDYMIIYNLSRRCMHTFFSKSYRSMHIHVFLFNISSKPLAFPGFAGSEHPQAQPRTFFTVRGLPKSNRDQRSLICELPQLPGSNTQQIQGLRAALAGNWVRPFRGEGQSLTRPRIDPQMTQ